MSPDNVDSKRLSKEQSTDSSTKQSPDDRSKLEDTPPGTPPPPYLSQSMINTSTQQKDGHDLGLSSPRSHPSSPTFMNNSGDNSIHAAQTNTTQRPIISMEDDEASDQELIEEHGPFTSVKELLDPKHSAHLAVFLNYVLSNSDPSPLLFYLITGLYKEGSVKDMRKWAYEIHSSFLVPRAVSIHSFFCYLITNSHEFYFYIQSQPLLWSSVDETMAVEVDGVLQKEYEKPEILRKIFWKTRICAKNFIQQQLNEFQDKRVAGLGTMYGPCDNVLMEAKGDKAKEQKIVEDTLIPKLQQYL